MAAAAMEDLPTWRMHARQRRAVPHMPACRYSVCVCLLVGRIEFFEFVEAPRPRGEREMAGRKGGGVKQGEAHVMRTGGPTVTLSAATKTKDGNRQAVSLTGVWSEDSQGRRETHPLPLQQHNGYLHHHQRTRSADCLQG